MKDKVYWIRFTNKFLIVSSILAIACAIVVRSLTPTSTQRRALSTRQQSDYRHAIAQYHDRYGRLPIRCTNITELARMLDGEDINGDNPDKVKFFYREMPLKKRVLDGYGFPFELVLLDDGDGSIHFVLRSYGSKKYREQRIKNAMPLQCNISHPHLLTLAEVEAEARVRTQANALTVTNRTVTGIPLGTEEVASLFTVSFIVALTLLGILFLALLLLIACRRRK